MQCYIGDGIMTDATTVCGTTNPPVPTCNDVPNVECTEFPGDVSSYTIYFIAKECGSGYNIGGDLLYVHQYLNGQWNELASTLIPDTTDWFWKSFIITPNNIDCQMRLWYGLGEPARCVKEWHQKISVPVVNWSTFAKSNCVEFDSCTVSPTVATGKAFIMINATSAQGAYRIEYIYTINEQSMTENVPVDMIGGNQTFCRQLVYSYEAGKTYKIVSVKFV